MTEVRFTLPFQHRLKSLTKRYRQIKQDIQPILAELKAFAQQCTAQILRAILAVISNRNR